MDILQAFNDHPGLLEDILTGLGQAVILIEPDGRIATVSEVVETLLGYRPEDLVGRNLSLLFLPEDQSVLYPNLLFLARSNQCFDGAGMLLRQDGSRLLANIMLRPCIGDAGKTPCAVFCFQYKKKKKKFEIAFDDMVKITNGIAHEIRNPLVGIGGFVKRLQKCCTQAEGDENIDQYYDYIINNVKRIENLVRKLDDLVSLPVPAYRPVSPHWAANRAMETFREDFGRRGIEFDNRMDELQIMADEELIVRMFRILFENALQALPENGFIKIRSRVAEDYFEILVIDNGRGISAKDLPFIFIPFYGTLPTGAGIGLAIARRIMEGHGGQIAAESEEGKGAMFILRFPFERRRSIRVAPMCKQSG